MSLGDAGDAGGRDCSHDDDGGDDGGDGGDDDRGQCVKDDEDLDDDDDEKTSIDLEALGEDEAPGRVAPSLPPCPSLRVSGPQSDCDPTVACSQ